MIDKRYQIFISNSGEEISLEHRLICQTLVEMGYFAWGIENKCDLTTTLARRQIDECDYVIFLLGDDYGKESISGISYMQLEYIYALAKQKPIIVFMHKYIAQKPKIRASDTYRKFNNFRELLCQEVADIFEYDTLDNLIQQVKKNVPIISDLYPTQGWVRAYNTRLLQDEIKRLKSKVAQFEIQLKTQSKPLLNSKTVQFSDIFCLDYQVYAYENDSFEVLVRTVCLTWLELIYILGHAFLKPQTEEIFAQSLNKYLMDLIWPILSLENPNLSHITNVAIHMRALYLIKLHVKQNHWIVSVGLDSRHRTLWQVSPKVKILIASKKHNL
ncbi:DUF4062 domain-containing protein [Acinetobacter nectaris]|uniref:DUF4062 domain-containing protein n=1 Tax=Acinetobacter nectaris TaxID=1219382 RepID=UPI001F3E0167|nr:DUF4062 domain-containing protein [Acinetobacter nectaris]MCF9033466.1 DUF4062 domain-containing protein [Acinetobacter nectaris]